MTEEASNGEERVLWVVFSSNHAAPTTLGQPHFLTQSRWGISKIKRKRFVGLTVPLGSTAQARS